MKTTSAIIVHPDFDHGWPWLADRLHKIWQDEGETEFVRLTPEDRSQAHSCLKSPSAVTRLACFGVAFTEESLAVMPDLREIVMLAPYLEKDSPLAVKMARAGVRHIDNVGEGFWGQSVAEFAFALTLCGLRRIPQTHTRIITSQEDWNYSQPDGIGRPGQRGGQFGDDPAFVNGTLEGKRVRIAGAGNVGSRYASFCNFFGAEVRMWGPTVKDPVFQLSGAKREHFLERLVSDADIFAPMMPLTPKTAGLIRKEHINALPKGCLVVLVTRAGICDCEALYRRVLNDELALAADVFDHEPLEIGNALLGRHNVVHTPHNAGRTKEANWRFAEMLAEQFLENQRE